ncbi:MAG: YkgJ family cysteine cluster protein [Spirochaetales bacterium]|nr:YkgJ family cysteine cluster protein [Spirochaetales bacterium]
MICDEYAKLLREAELDFEENKKFIMILKRLRAKTLDREINVLHDRAFAEIDCLKCGNCCRTVPAIIQQKDIKALAKRFHCRPIVWEKEFTVRDEDEDLVMNQTPCPFIADDNYCMYYEDKPKYCRDYPYTDSTRLRNYLRETMENTKVCPAVYLIVKWLKEGINNRTIF